jgi:hypothetical protein
MNATTKTAFETWMVGDEKPSVYTFAAAVALAGLENQWFVMSSADQRRLLGAVVFGKKRLRVSSDPSRNHNSAPVMVLWTSGFGRDREIAYLHWSDIAERVEAAKAGLSQRW